MHSAASAPPADPFATFTSVRPRLRESALAIVADGDRAVAIYVLRHPDKLAGISAGF